MNSYDLNGRVAVVTGGAQGLGLAIGERFMASGATVVCWDVDDALLDALPAALHSQRVDVSDVASIEAATADVLKAHGKIDILVNNAGITGPNAKTWDYAPEDWSRVMRINLDGPFLTARAIVPQMIAQNYGRVINIASVAGKDGNPNAPAYSASKAGVIGLTKSLGKELADTKVTANCITPAAIKTAIFDQMTQTHIDYMLSKIPMGRFGTTDELAAMATWIASEESSFTTGAVFDFSGGRSTY
ncbi:SDR family NAD(P)-dependent oxidoreductase [Marivita hallyeonensis]|uniref:3-oxoacyl-[acyl-carrier protein] reductase n=1 Tax=Marivita hallyeonensis TaxID=996342 RepID=A0A1M5XMQ2_9RHOB|nr:SDR family NAD(P)-dependent oxidoreductase [Marivita hallyeonensis]SHI01036.1 3-oxoacyl-[acyl-carrier protein] reductase [Marivita hallyeonensis]